MEGRVKPMRGVKKKKKKKRPSLSKFYIISDASQGSPKRRQVCKRVKKKLSFSVERGADGSHGEICGSSEPHQVKSKRVKPTPNSMVQREIEARKRETHHGSEIDPFLRLKNISKISPSVQKEKNSIVDLQLKSKMEGRVSGEPKSHGKKLLSPQASSESHRVKKKKKRPSLSKFYIIYVSQGITKRREVCKRVKKKRSSSVENGEIGGSSEPRQVKSKRVKPTPNSMVQRAIDARKRGTHLESEIDPFLRLRSISKTCPRMMKVNESIMLGYAKDALKFYEKSQGARFEIVEVFYSSRSTLGHPESVGRFEECVHVSFTAKPKIGDCCDPSPPIYLFGELFVGYRSSYANSCFTFEPSDAGFNHGCIFCSADQKFHPATGYHVGRLPWFVPGITWI